MRIEMLLVAIVVTATNVVAQNVNGSNEKQDSTATEWGDTLQLQDVEVVTMRQLVKTLDDRLSYNVEADPEARTSTLLDVLRRVPLVSVDGEDNVRVNGSGSFKIYKNGHPDPALSSNPKEVLRAMPASMIKRIEVITEPGARYDAEGVTAILNIVTVKGTVIQGVNGTVTASVNTFGSPNASAYIAARLGKFTLGATGFYQKQSHRQFAGEDETWTTYKDTRTTIYNLYRNKQPAWVYSLDLNASYELDSLNLITASFGGYRYGLKIYGDSHSDYHDASGQLFTSYDNPFNLPHYGFMSWNGRADWEHRTSRADEVLTASYMFSTTGHNEEQFDTLINLVNPPFDYTGYNKWGKERFIEHTWQLDYQLPLWSHHQLEVGGKYILRLNHSHNTMHYDGAEGLDTDTRFKHDMHVGSAYASWRYKVGDFTLRGGLRYEYSHFNARYPNGDGEPFGHDLHDLVPSASVHWQMSQDNSVRLSWATSLNRPGIEYLNPAVRRYTATIEYGNPNLSSARNTMLGITFQHVGSRLTFNLKPSVTITNNLIGTYRTVQDGIVHLTNSNDCHYLMAGAGGFVQWMMTGKTTLVMNGEFCYKRYRNPSQDLTNSGWGGNLYAQLTQQLPWKLRATATCMWYGIGHDVRHVYGYSTIPNPTVMLSLSRSFLKDDRLTVRLNAYSVLRKYEVSKGYITQGDYVNHAVGHFNQRNVQILLSYRFGSSNTRVKQTETTVENDDLVGGLRSGN
jgi:outer membrane receptor for ferrienterochelin and colicin